VPESWSGFCRNCTPDKLTTIEKDSVIGACNMALRAIMALLQPRLVVGVGATLSFELLFELFYDLMNHASSIIIDWAENLRKSWCR
jgi:hypothetical protein